MTATGSRARRRSRGRGRTARSEVALVLIGVAVLSLLLDGVFNYVTARRLLNDAVETELIDIGAARAARIGEGLRAVEDTVVALAADGGVVEALLDLTAGYAEVDQTLTAAQEDELRALYRTGIADVAPPGIDPPPLDALVPDSERTRYLQYLYIVENPFPAGERSRLIVADDGSDYSRAHAQHHPMLRALAEANLFGDLILVDAASGSVIYSVDKRVDFGTDLASGPYRDSALAEAVLGELASAVPAEAVVVDFEPYLPASGAPSMFIASPIRSEGRVVGALAIESNRDVLDSITTANGDWEGTGLGETGEIYVVGPDLLMRSDSRLWLEEPARYLQAVADAGYSAEIIDAVEAFATTALIQPVDTEAVATALGGDSFADPTVNYLGEDTLTVAAPLDARNLGWVMVAEMMTAEADGPIQDYRRRALVMAAVLLPLVALLGMLFTGRLLRPVARIAAAARIVGDGDLDVALSEESRDEFGELGRRFNAMVAALRDQEARLGQVDDEATELLAAVLPGHMVEQVKRGDTSVAEALRNATLIALLVDEPDRETPVEEELLQDLRVELSADMATLARRYQVEPLHTSASQLLFAAGLRSEGTEAVGAVEFAMEALTTVARRGEQHGVPLSVHAGLAAGDVVAGVVGTERLAFDVWGEPLRTARALATRAGSGEAVVDGLVVSEIAGDWVVDQVPDLMGGELEPQGWRIGARHTAKRTGH